MIIYACSDLIFATKVRSTAQALGVATRPVRNADMLRSRLDRVDDGKGNAPVTAVLIDMDLGDAALELIALVKTHSPATPAIAFGAHVAVELLNAAAAAGADQVMPRGRFTAELPAILRTYGPSRT